MTSDSGSVEPGADRLGALADDAVLGSTGYLLLKAGVHVGHAIEQAMRDLGLSMRDLLVLSFAAVLEGMSQQELSERLGLDPTLVVGLVDGLEERDLVRREGPRRPPSQHGGAHRGERACDRRRSRPPPPCRTTTSRPVRPAANRPPARCCSTSCRRGSRGCALVVDQKGSGTFWRVRSNVVQPRSQRVPDLLVIPSGRRGRAG
ncbi:MAG: MarR family transcriptional regulator [Ilumatobacteraceae bacterium]